MDTFFLQVEVRRYPKLGETVSTSTWASGFHGFFGDRNFIMQDKDGEVVAYANSIWVYMDLEPAGRPGHLRKKSPATEWKSRIQWSTRPGK